MPAYCDLLPVCNLFERTIDLVNRVTPRHVRRIRVNDQDKTKKSGALSKWRSVKERNWHMRLWRAKGKARAKGEKLVCWVDYA